MVMSDKVLFFDLDDTLYDHESGLWEAIRDRMNTFLQEQLRLSLEDAVKLRQEYYQRYGTTLKGLLIEHDIDVNAYLAYVHDVPLSKYLKPEPQITAMISDLNYAKFIFTNADKAHAKRVLDHLGFANIFQKLIDIRALEFHCKPEPRAYQLAMERAGVSEPSKCLLIDDSPRNILAAQNFGFLTVLVNNGFTYPTINIQISSISQLPTVLRDL
jgi:putative hydrolase of the HAD superfamily